MDKTQIGDSSTNRSDVRLMHNNDQLNLLPKDDPEKDRILEENLENEVKVVITESLSEVSANDYGYYTLKINDEIEEKNNPKFTKMKKGYMGMINNEFNLSLKSNNFLNLLNKNSVDKNTGKKFKLVKSDFELLMHLGRDENEYKEFKIINPNEEIYTKMVNII